MATTLGAERGSSSSSSLRRWRYSVAVRQAAGIASDWLDGYPSAEDFARTLVHCIDLPENCVIDEAIIWGTRQVKEMLNPY